MNIHFWETYLQNASYLYFPESQIIKKNTILNTSYIRIPDKLLKQIQTFCTAKRLCITETLTAAIGKCLAPYVKNKMLVINLVNSTREHDMYDEAIGPFIRSDVVKVDVNQSDDFVELSKRVKNCITETAPWQTCPTIVKLGCSFKTEWENNTVSNGLISTVTKIYACLFPKFKLDHRILKMFFHVFIAQNPNRFFLNVNIMNSFITQKKDSQLFSYNTKKIMPHYSDKTVDKNILNIWFYRDSEHIANMILSGNLEKPFLDSLGNDILDTISDACVQDTRFLLKQ